MAWNNAVVTNVGMNLLAQAAGGTALTICSAKCGSTAVDTSALVLQNDVSEPKKAVQITGSEVKENRVKISVRVTNNGVSESYVIKQIGLYAKQAGSEEEKLVAVIQDSTGETIPTESENPNFQIDFAFSIVVANARNITVTAASEAYVSVEDFNEKLSSKQDNLYTLGSGNPVVMDELQGGVPFPEIVVSGKNLIPYPYNRTSGVYNGLTVDISDDGKFSVNGTATADTIIFEFAKQSNPIYLSGGVSYTLNCSQQYNIDSFNIFFKVYHADKTYSGYTKYPASFTAKNGDYLEGSLWIKSGSVVNAENVEIQLELGNTPTEYEPPITGRELTLNINGTEIAVTPDSNPYTVPDDIRQQDGLNVLTVSAGKLTVIGNTINPQLKKTVDMIDDNATKLYSLDSSGNPYIGEDKENNKVYVQWDGVKYLKLSSRFNKTAADYAASAGIVGVVSYPSSGTTGDVVLGFKPSCVIAVSQSFTNSTAGQKTFAVMITGSIAQTLYHPDGSVIISLTDTGFTANFNSGTVNMFRYIAFK